MARFEMEFGAEYDNDTGEASTASIIATQRSVEEGFMAQAAKVLPAEAMERLEMQRAHGVDPRPLATYLGYDGVAYDPSRSQAKWVGWPGWPGAQEFVAREVARMGR